MVTNPRRVGGQLMGVWDLRGLHQEIQKWEKLAKTVGISDGDRDFYLRRAEEAKLAYKRERDDWEVRAIRFDEDKDGQRSE